MTAQIAERVLGGGCPSRTRAGRCAPTRRSWWPRTARSTSAIRTRPGSGAATRTPTGLLRQYFPKDPAGPAHLAAVTGELNGRPRKTLGWKTPPRHWPRSWTATPPPDRIRARKRWRLTPLITGRAPRSIRGRPSALKAGRASPGATALRAGPDLGDLYGRRSSRSAPASPIPPSCASTGTSGPSGRHSRPTSGSRSCRTGSRPAMTRPGCRRSATGCSRAPSRCSPSGGCTASRCPSAARPRCQVLAGVLDAAGRGLQDPQRRSSALISAHHRPAPRSANSDMNMS